MKNVFWLAVLCLMMACNSADKSTATATTTTAPVKVEPKKPTKAKPAANNTKSAVNWVSWAEAQKLNASNPKKILVDVYTSWCGPCKMMDRSTFSDAKVAAHINENYYPVKFNAESPGKVTYNGKEFDNPGYNPDTPKNRRNSAHELVRELGIRGYPTLVVMGSDFKVKSNLVGFKRPDQLMTELQKL